MVLRENGEQDGRWAGRDVIQGAEGEWTYEHGEEERWKDGGDEAGYDNERLF